MPYDAQGNYDSTVHKDEYGFVNRTAVTVSTNPYTNSYPGMNHVKAAPLISKEVG